MISGSFNASSASFSTRTTVLESNPVFTSTIISGSFNAPSASFSTRVAVLENNPTVTPGTLSGSAQIAANISGSFVAPSASFSTRVSNLKIDSGSFSTRTTTLESNPVFSSTSISGSLGTNATLIRSLTATGISGSFISPSASFSTRVATLELNPVFSASMISGSFVAPSASFSTRITNLKTDSGSFSTRTTTLEANPVFTSAMISGSFAAPSSSFSSRVAFLEEGGAVGFTSAGISGSLGTNATLIRSLTATKISGSFVAPSSSFSIRVTNNKNDINSNRSLITGITSSLTTAGRVVFTTADGGLGTEEGFGYNTTTNQLTVDSLNVIHLTSSFITASSISTSGSNIFGDDTTDIQTLIGTVLITGSAQITGSLGVTNNINASGTIIGSNLSGTNTGDQNLSSFALKTAISGSFIAPSSSLSTRVTSLEGNSVFTSAGISGSLGTNATLIRSLTATKISGSFIAPSSSLSTRITSLEGNDVFTSAMISGSFIAPSASFSTRVTSNKLVSSQNASNISSNLTKINSLTSVTSSYALKTGISGSFVAPSASFSTRVSFLEEGGAVGFTSAGISGSLGPNATLIRSLTATIITGSFTRPSASFSTRVTATSLLVEANTNKVNSVIIVTGSYAITGSNNFIGNQDIAGSLTISGSIYRTAIITSTIANITQSIHSLSTSSFDGAFIEYTAVSASNARAGNIMSVWDGTNVTFAETTTTDIGDTSNLLFQVALTQSVAQIQSYTTSTGYRLRTIIKAI